MRRKVRRSLVSAFERELQQALPQFNERVRESVIQGWVVYRGVLHPPMNMYIILPIGEMNESFTFEFAWGEVWPILNYLFPEQLQTFQHFPESGRIRVGSFWGPQGDFWWDTAPLPPKFIEEVSALRDGTIFDLMPTEDQSIASIPELLDDAFAKFNLYIPPLIEHLRNSRNNSA